MKRIDLINSITSLLYECDDELLAALHSALCSILYERRSPNVLESLYRRFNKYNKSDK